LGVKAFFFGRLCIGRVSFAAAQRPEKQGGKGKNKDR